MDVSYRYLCSSAKFETATFTSYRYILTDVKMDKCNLMLTYHRLIVGYVLWLVMQMSVARNPLVICSFQLLSAKKKLDYKHQ